MSLPPTEMRWWGWGDEAHDSAPPEHALGWLRDELGGLGETVSPPVAIEDVRLREPSLPDGLRDALGAAVGADGVRDDRRARVLRAAGKGYPDLVRLRAGDAESAPDVVVFPESHDQVRRVLDACAAAGAAVVPFGGGTSVVGGVEPWRGELTALVSLDLGRMNRLAELDEHSLLARFEPGMRLPAVEAALGEHGYTLGHFPQSFEYASVGGCVATRSAGQASTGYGRIDGLVRGLRAAAPAGDIDLMAVPASAAGPDLRELMVGSEGALGVLTEVSLRVRRAPEAKVYDAYMLPSFDVGAELLRALVQQGLAPQVARLSDEDETRMSLALAGTSGLKGAALSAYLRARRVRGGCLSILGWEGSPAGVRAAREAAAPLIRSHGAAGLGGSPGRAWAHGRFGAPYLRDDLLDRGVMVETLETATTWTNLLALYRGVGAALRAHAPFVACHISHLYPTGASLYFTFLAPQERGDEHGQWARVKAAACEAIVAAGGTISHHHAVGRDHVPYLGAETGELGLELLRAAKRELDPAGIMNPGKLLSAAGPTAT